MEKNWTKIYTLTDPIGTEMCKQLLEQNGIPTVLMNKQDSAFKFGKLELYVNDSDVERAKRILEDELDETNED